MKRLASSIYAGLFLIALVSSCQKEPSLILTGLTSIDVPSDGGSGTISFTANRDWKASWSEPWVSVSPSSGSASDGPITITVRCEANTTYDERKATVSITAENLAQSVAVRQSAKLGLIASSKEYAISSESQEMEVEIQSNVQYTVSTSEDWIKLANTKGLTKDVLVFSVSENETYNDRSATIIIKSQESIVAEQIISVTQAAKDLAVDLGLSVKWAKMNLGAATITEHGDFYAWGEAYPRSSFNEANYKLPSLSKYNSSDGKTTLDPEDDAAHVKLGGKWRMPTKSEWLELKDEENCSWVSTTIDGVKGFKVSSNKTGLMNNWIFLPAAGHAALPDYSVGAYWSSTVDTEDYDNAWFFSCDFGVNRSIYMVPRFNGLSIRPVTD